MNEPTPAFPIVPTDDIIKVAILNRLVNALEQYKSIQLVKAKSPDVKPEAILKHPSVSALIAELKTLTLQLSVRLMEKGGDYALLVTNPHYDTEEIIIYRLSLLIRFLEEIGVTRLIPTPRAS